MVLFEKFLLELYKVYYSLCGKYPVQCIISLLDKFLFKLADNNTAIANNIMKTCNEPCRQDSVFSVSIMKRLLALLR